MPGYFIHSSLADRIADLVRSTMRQLIKFDTIEALVMVREWQSPSIVAGKGPETFKLL